MVKKEMKKQSKEVKRVSNVLIALSAILLIIGILYLLPINFYSKGLMYIQIIINNILSSLSILRSFIFLTLILLFNGSNFFSTIRITSLVSLELAILIMAYIFLTLAKNLNKLEKSARISTIILFLFLSLCSLVSFTYHSSNYLSGILQSLPTIIVSLCIIIYLSKNKIKKQFR